MQRPRRAALIVLAFSSSLANLAGAGPNEDATFSLAGEASVSEVGPGEVVTLQIDVEGLVEVKNLEVVLEVSDGELFDLGSVKLVLGEGFEDVRTLLAPSQLEPETESQVRLAVAVLPDDQVDGAAGFSLTVRTSDSFTTETRASVGVALISIGPSPSVRDEFTAGDLGLTLEINPPPPPVTEPSMEASTATDVSADYSVVGTGAAVDGSDGEVTLGVSFADAAGAAAAGQTIEFTVANAGSENVYLFGADGASFGVSEAGGTVTLSVDTDDSGAAAITLDVEGDDSAGSTSVSVSAAASAPDTEGTAVDLNVGFSVTWDVAVPAELASFAGEIAGEDEILLRWAVPSQTNNLGWEVYRSLDGEVFERVGKLVPGEGTTDEFRTYEFVDDEPLVAEVVYYYLRQIDLNGAVTRSETIDVLLLATGLGEQVVPVASGLQQNYPNPFNPETTIRFDLAEGAFVSLRIYDGLGQVVRTLAESVLPSGSYRKVWDGRDARGLRVGSGVYYYELRAGTFTSMKKMTLVQ